MSRFFKSAAFPILIVVLLAFLAVKLVNPGSSNHHKHSYQTLVGAELPRGEVESVQIKNKGKALEVKYKNKESAEFGFIDQAAPELIKELRSAGVQYNIESEKSSAILSLLTYILPFIIFLGFWIFLMNQVQGGGSKVMSFGKSRAKRLSADSPKITFRDVAAVGRHRGAGLGGGHDEREQTLNQLLVEMDGFEAKDNIIMIAATNRPDILDPALLRPGRFDRQIAVDRPDRKGRAKILEVHTRGKPLAKEIDIDALAGQTPGFTGADLSNLINEAALLAARTGKREIAQDELEEGIMRVIAGPEKKTRVMSEKERLITAYHEMGHAIVGHYLEHSDPVHKISVISRGQALGYTISLPQEDKFLTTRAELNDTMSMTLGGRAAEEIIFGEITTGASNDIEKVTQTAKQMVMRFGMSEKLGPRVSGHDHAQPFLGREFSSEPDYSDEIAREIDDEIRRIVESSHQKAKDILTEHRSSLEKISQILVKRETIEKEEFEALLAGKTEEDVFPPEEPSGPEIPLPPHPADREREKAPRPLPRPGLAGGTAELRGLDSPEKPELA